MVKRCSSASLRLDPKSIRGTCDGAFFRREGKVWTATYEKSELESACFSMAECVRLHVRTSAYFYRHLVCREGEV